jgi:hypothetical protein
LVPIGIDMDAELGHWLTCAAADHATPGGSKAVARTKRIQVEQWAEAAVIARMRHQTICYDAMVISRATGKRRALQ